MSTPTATTLVGLLSSSSNFLTSLPASGTAGEPVKAQMGPQYSAQNSPTPMPFPQTVRTEEFILAGRLAFALSYWEVISRPLESPDRQECFCQYTDFRHQSHNVIYDEGCGTRYL